MSHFNLLVLLEEEYCTFHLLPGLCNFWHPDLMSVHVQYGHTSVIRYIPVQLLVQPFLESVCDNQNTERWQNVAIERCILINTNTSVTSFLCTSFVQNSPCECVMVSCMHPDVSYPEQLNKFRWVSIFWVLKFVRHCKFWFLSGQYNPCFARGPNINVLKAAVCFKKCSELNSYTQ